MRLPKLLIVTPLVLAALAVMPQARSDDSINDLVAKSLEELSDYKVDAPTRSSLRLSETPGAVSVFTYDQIHNQSAQTIPDLMRLVPGMNVRWTPMVEMMDMRSFGSSPFSGNMLLMIDGVPYNSWDKGGFPDHPGFDFFDLQNVKHIEVIRGGGSALYGENAFNGVLNIVTLSGEELKETRAAVYGGGLHTRYVSVLNGSRLGEDGSLMVSGRKTQSVLPTDLWINESKGGGTKGSDIFIKGKYQGLQVSAYQRADHTDGFAHAEANPLLPPGTLIESVPDIRQRIDIYALQYQHSAANDQWSIKFNASRQTRTGTSCAACHAAASGPNTGKTEHDGYENYANLQFGLRMFAQHDVILGTEFRRLSAGNDPLEKSAAMTVDPNVISAYRKEAIYAQDRITMLAGKASVIAGLRYDTDTSPSEFGRHVFPRIAAVYSPLDRLTLRANWSKAARYPTFTEQYNSTWFLDAVTPFGAIPLANFVPNFKLKPELQTETDLGAEYRFSERLHVKLDLYEKHLHDFIDVTYPGGSFSGIGFQNEPNEAKSRGFEFEVRDDITDGLTMFANYAMQLNSQSGNGVDPAGRPIQFTYSPRNKINAGITWVPVPSVHATLDASWRDTYVAPAFWYTLVYPADPVQRPLPAYTYVNSHLSYTLPGFATPARGTLSVAVDGRNLLNDRVYETLTSLGGKAAGREFYVGLRYDLPN